MNVSEKLCSDIHVFLSIISNRLTDEVSPWYCYSYPKSGDTVSIVAARFGQVAILHYLTSVIEDPDQRKLVLEQTNRNGKRPIHEAAQNGQLECLQFLIDQGVDVNCMKQQDWWV